MQTGATKDESRNSARSAEAETTRIVVGTSKGDGFGRARGAGRRRVRRLREETPTGTWKRGFEGVRRASEGALEATTTGEEGAEVSEEEVEEQEVRKEAS
jgi:hypothetical protein